MRRIDIVLALLFVALVAGLVLLPDVISRWRADDAAKPPAAVEAEPADPVDPADTQPPAGVRTPYDPEVERERVSGMLMLHQACVNRFEGFDARTRETLAEGKQHHAAVFAAGGVEQDFLIVLAPREDVDDASKGAANKEELALCERNVEAMQADVGDSTGN